MSFQLNCLFKISAACYKSAVAETLYKTSQPRFSFIKIGVVPKFETERSLIYLRLLRVKFPRMGVEYVGILLP